MSNEELERRVIKLEDHVKLIEEAIGILQRINARQISINDDLTSAVIELRMKFNELT